MEYIYTYDEMLNESKFLDIIHKWIKSEKDIHDKFFSIVHFISQQPHKMRHFMFSALISLSLNFMPASELYDMINSKDTVNTELKDIAKVEITKHKKKNKSWKINLKSFSQLMTDVGKSESSNQWDNDKNPNYFGYFQLGRMALSDIDFDIDSYGIKKFLNNKDLQIKCFKKLLKKNKKYLREYIKKYNYQYNAKADCVITESGILMGAHLVGAGAVKQFFDSNGTIIPKDGNKVPVTHYMKKFSRYKVDL